MSDIWIIDFFIDVELRFKAKVNLVWPAGRFTSKSLFVKQPRFSEVGVAWHQVPKKKYNNN